MTFSSISENPQTFLSRCCAFFVADTVGAGILNSLADQDPHGSAFNLSPRSGFVMHLDPAA